MLKSGANTSLNTSKQVGGGKVTRGSQIAKTKSMLMDAFEEQMETSNNDKLRQIFLESYGIEMNFAGYYYQDAKFVPNQNNYLVCSSWHIVPENPNLEV